MKNVKKVLCLTIGIFLLILYIFNQNSVNNYLEIDKKTKIEIMKTIICKKGKTTKIIDNFGTGYAKTFRIRISSKIDEPLKGTYTEKRYMWIFPEKPITGELKEKMSFHRKWINGVYSVSITPKNEVTVEFY